MKVGWGGGGGVAGGRRSNKTGSVDSNSQLLLAPLPLFPILFETYCPWMLNPSLFNLRKSNMKVNLDPKDRWSLMALEGLV